MAEKAKPKQKASKYESRKACPKCGPGYHLAEHKNRRTCGKCKYMETKTADVKA